MNEIYIYINYNEFISNDILLLESTTGTGKTTSTAKVCNQFLEKVNKNKKYQILSIVSKEKLCEQHIQSFKKKDINMVSYKNENKKINDDHICCCINSILILKDIKESDFKNYIVYIDEITSFLNDLCGNTTLTNLKECYTILMKIIKNCYKLILSDAMITDNTFNFIKNRTVNNKVFFIKNLYKKYKNVDAYKCLNENIFLNTMLKDIKNDKYFLFATDSRKT